MLEQIEGKLGEHHFGEICRETAEAKAERFITEELSRLGWQETQTTPAQADQGGLGI